jgi:hypothetical protein
LGSHASLRLPRQTLRKWIRFPNPAAFRHPQIRRQGRPANGGFGKIGTAAATRRVDIDE